MDLGKDASALQVELGLKQINPQFVPSVTANKVADKRSLLRAEDGCTHKGE